MFVSSVDKKDFSLNRKIDFKNLVVIVVGAPECGNHPQSIETAGFFLWKLLWKLFSLSNTQKASETFKHFPTQLNNHVENKCLKHPLKPSP